MSRRLAAIRRLLRREPVRGCLYSILIAIVGYQRARNHLHLDDANLYLELGAAFLGVETARATVTPIKPVKKAPVSVRVRLGDGVQVQKVVKRSARKKPSA